MLSDMMRGLRNFEVPRARFRPGARRPVQSSTALRFLLQLREPPRDRDEFPPCDSPMNELFETVSLIQMRSVVSEIRKYKVRDRPGRI